MYVQELVFICLKCVFASRIDFSLNLVPLYTAVSKNAVSVSNVSAVNLTSMSDLLMSHREKILCM